MKKNYLIIYIATISFLAISCNLSTSRNNHQATDSVAGSKTERESVKEESKAEKESVKEEPKAEWENENFLSNSDEFEKNLSEKAKKGDKQALMDLGLRFLWPQKLNSKIKENESLAISLLTQASEKGNADAQMHLAGIYLGHYGSGKYKNIREGQRWIETAAANGLPDAEFRMGYNYSKGEDGYPQDYTKALEWRKRFAVKGSTPKHVEAQFNVGWQYWNGKGVYEDKVEAMKWYKMAAENGDPTAQRIVQRHINLLQN